MPSRRILLLFFLFVHCSRFKAENPARTVLLSLPGCYTATLTYSEAAERPGPLVQLRQLGHNARRLNRKVTAAILAFPFPFGIVGLHRIYLGCAPYVPVVYIASLGGAFGILPLMDFIAIITAKDLDRFSNSGKVFMWVE